MSSSLITLGSILILTITKNRSPFFMNLGMILVALSLAFWALWLINKWMFNVFIIFYLGGMMVLFAYIISLNKSKHTFFVSPFTAWAPALVILVMLNDTLDQTSQFYFKSYSHSSWHFVFLLAILLLALLLAVNKISMSHYGPLTSKQHDC